MKDERHQSGSDIIEDVPARPIIGGAADEPRTKSTHSWCGIAVVAAVIVIAVVAILIF